MLRAVIALFLLSPRWASSQPTLEGVYTLRDRADYMPVFKGTPQKSEPMPRCDAKRSAEVDSWRGHLIARYRGAHVVIREEDWVVRFVDAKRVVAVRPAPKDSDHRLEIMLVRRGSLASALLLYRGLDKDGHAVCVTAIGLTGDYAP